MGRGVVPNVENVRDVIAIWANVNHGRKTQIVQTIKVSPQLVLEVVRAANLATIASLSIGEAVDENISVTYPI